MNKMNTYYIIGAIMLVSGMLTFVTDSSSILFLMYLPLAATFFFLGADEAKKRKKDEEEG